VAAELINVFISEESLTIEPWYSQVQVAEAGGNCLFVGTVRNENKGQLVTHLEFESYVPMALKEMAKIANEAKAKFNLTGCTIAHRTGKCEVGDIAVIIATSSKHRKQAFEACEFAIDELKRHVPIWKKEFLVDGSYWVNSRP